MAFQVKVHEINFKCIFVQIFQFFSAMPPLAHALQKIYKTANYVA